MFFAHFFLEVQIEKEIIFTEANKSHIMKKLLLLSFSFFLFTFSFSSKAQWVTIPDANFVPWLTANYPTCMSGNQMDTTCSGIVNAVAINCNSISISNLTGIQYFDNLQQLNCSDNQLTSLSVVHQSLTYLDCTLNSISSLPTLSNNLITLHCSDNVLTSLPILPNSLTNLECGSNLLTSLPALSNSLSYLDCYGNLLDSLPSLPNSLLHLTCFSNHLTILPVLPNNLQYLACGDNQLISIPVLPNTLTNLGCGLNQLTSLPILPDSLFQLVCNGNPGLTCFPQIKIIYSLNFTGTNITCVPNYGHVHNSNPNISSLPLCNLFNNSGCPIYWNITGSAYQDINNDCIHQSNENSFNQVKINLKQSGNLLQQEISNTGDYSFNTYLNTYQVELDTANLPMRFNCFSNGSNDTTVNVTVNDSLIYGVDFGMHCKPGFDIGANSAARDSGRFIPGRFCLTTIYSGDMSNFYGAHCAAGVGGSVVATFIGPVTFAGFKAGSLAPTTVNGNTVTWNIADFGNVNFNSDFHLRFHTDTSAQIGQQVCFTVSVTPTAGDNDTTNNFWSGCFAVQTSFDPNEKKFLL